MDFERASTLMGLNGPYTKLIYHDNTVFESWIDFRFTLMHKGVLVIIKGCIEDSEKGL